MRSLAGLRRRPAMPFRSRRDRSTPPCTAWKSTAGSRRAGALQTLDEGRRFIGSRPTVESSSVWRWPNGPISPRLSLACSIGRERARTSTGRSFTNSARVWSEGGYHHATAIAESDSGESGPLAERSHDHLVTIDQERPRLSVWKMDWVPATPSALYHRAAGFRLRSRHGSTAKE